MPQDCARPINEQRLPSGPSGRGSEPWPTDVLPGDGLVLDEGLAVTAIGVEVSQRHAEKAGNSES